MSPYRCGVSLVLFLAAVAAFGSDLTLGELIDRHTQARGGSEAIEAVHSLEIELHIVETTFEVTGLYRADREPRMRIDVFSDGQRVFSEGLSFASAWQWHGGADHAEPIVAEASAALRHGAILNLLGLHELEAAGHELRYLGIEDFGSEQLHSIEITLDDGFKKYEYLDPETYLIVRSRSFRAFHPDLDPEKKWHETRFSDFRPVGGQVRAFAQETVDLTTGESISTTTTKSIRLNPALDPNLFQAP